MDCGALRAQAERCRRLARSIYNLSVTDQLEAYARQLEELAARLQQAVSPPEVAPTIAAKGEGIVVDPGEAAGEHASGC